MIDYMASAGPHISVKVDEVLNVAGVSITNSHLMGILGIDRTGVGNVPYSCGGFR